MRKFLWIFPLVLFVACLEARADGVIVGYQNPGTLAFQTGPSEAFDPIGPNFGNTDYEDAVQFTLDGSFDVSDINVLLSTGVGVATFSWSLQDGLTGSPSTLASGSGEALGGTPSYDVDLPIDLTLGPGTYYVVITSPVSAGSFGWMVSDGTETSNGGTAPNGFWFSDSTSAPDWRFFSSSAVCDASKPCPIETALSTVYTVNGSAVVPEPATVVLLVLGMTLLVAFRKRVPASRHAN